MSDFEKFKNDILLNYSPVSPEEISSMADKINTNAHKHKLFTDQFNSYITDLPIFSVEISKLFAIGYIEKYHQWLTENFDITPKK